MDYKKKIKAYVPQNEQEVQDQKLILDYLNKYDNGLTRENEIAHVTCSGFIINETRDKVLMAYHNLFDSWAWTGGHADGEGNLLQVALKEAQEETGIESVLPLDTEIIALDVLPVWGHEKRGRYVSAHLHLNVSYLLVADEMEAVRIKADENSAVGWIPLSELESYCSEPQMMPVYKKIMKRLY